MPKEILPTPSFSSSAESVKIPELHTAPVPRVIDYGALQQASRSPDEVYQNSLETMAKAAVFINRGVRPT